MKRVLTTVVCAVGVVGCAGAQSFNALGDAGEAVVPNAISDDGRVIVGAKAFNGLTEGFRWTAETGVQGLGFLGGGATDVSSASGISGDGRTIIGFSSSTSSPNPFTGEAFVWREGTGLAALGFVGSSLEPRSSAGAANTDGSVIVGISSSPNVFGPDGFEATKWVNGVAEGLGLGETSTATSVSGDGSVVVGARAGITKFQQPVVLHNGVSMDLEEPSVPGPFPFDTGGTALDVSRDGSTVVGWATLENQVGARWNAQTGQIQVLEMLTGFDTALAEEVSADGSVAVGTMSSFFGNSIAVMWDADGRAFDLNDVLGDVIPDGWHLLDARGVSADGLTFVGIASDGDGLTRGWVATIPTPGGLGTLIVLMPLMARRRRVCSP